MNKRMMGGLTKSLEENKTYLGLRGEIVTIPLVGVAVHDGVNVGGTVLTEQSILNRNGIDNIVRNSNFIFDQNGNSWLGNSGNTYISDGWYIQHGGGSTSNAARLSAWEPTLNQVTQLRVTTFSGGGSDAFSLLSQRYARLRRYAGQVMTISYWIKANVKTSISGECGLTFADGGTANRNTLINRVTLPANVWTKVEQTFTVPMITGADVIDDSQDHMYIYFWLEAGDDYNDRTGGLLPFSGSFDIGNIKIEYGDQATAYSTMTFRDEEKKVHEYFEKSSLLRYFSPFALTSPAASCGLNVDFGNPKWNTLPDVTFTTDFVNAPALGARNQFGFTLGGIANSGGSTARLLTYTADSEITP